jgi:hypothetical protein
MRRFLLEVSLFALISTPGFSGQITASVAGTVIDPSGATVPNAIVRVTNVNMNLSRQGITDLTGNYLISSLPAATYQLTVSCPGFRTNTIRNLIVEIAQTIRVDLRMEVGDVTEALDISSPLAGLQTENATMGVVIEPEKIQELPLNGRNFVQLAQLIPGAQTGTPGSITVRRGRGPIGQTDSDFGSTGLSVNGVRDTANRYFLDGVELMDGDAFTYAFPPSLDSLSEFKVETNLYSAQAGAAPGAQVNLITKPGTKDFRGALWEFNRNDALSSTYDAIASKDLRSPRLNRNQFGANLGGPASRSAFFFFNFERGLQALGAAPGLAIVPTDAQRNGDLRGLTNARTRQPILLRDPLNVGIADNRIPLSALSPQAKTFLQFEPRSNTQNGLFNYVSSPVSPISTQSNYTARIDKNASTKDAIMSRYVINDTLEKGTPFWGHDERDNLSRTQNAVASHVRTFSSRGANEFRAGWNHVGESEIFGTSNDSSYDVAGKMGIPMISRRPQDFGPPSIAINGPDGGISTYTLQRQIGPRLRRYALWQFDEILSWQNRGHTLRLGGQWSRRNFYFSQARNARGSFTFDGTYTGSALADFLLGYVKQANINSTPTRTNMSSWWQAYFINDEWRLRSKLTLSLGIRYDYFQRWTEDDNKIVNIGQDGVLLTNFITPATSAFGRSLLAPGKKNFGPRFGMAWRPGFVEKTVVRGGYGIYYQMEHPNANFSMIEGAQATAGGTVIGSSSGIPDVFFSDPSRQIVSSGALNNATSIDPNERDAYVQQWNLTLEQRLPWETVLDIGYAGTKGTRLSVAFDEDGMAFNRPVELVDPRTPGLPGINLRRPNPLFPRAVEGVKSIGNSTYHGLQVRVERRLSRGLTFLTSYTWSKALSGPHDQGGLIGNGSFIGTPQDYYNLRAERSLAGFDQPHRFTQTVLYDLPSLPLRSFGGHLLGGWQVAAIVAAQSGFPAGIDYGVDTTGTGQPSRADVVPGVNPNLASGKRTWAKWFNPDAFAPAQWGRWGTSPRTGSIRLPGYASCDLAFSKNFPFGEKRRIQFRTEFFNLTNHFNPEPRSVDRNVQSATFGSIGGGVRGVTTRVVQLAARIYF